MAERNPLDELKRFFESIRQTDFDKVREAIHQLEKRQHGDVEMYKGSCTDCEILKKSLEEVRESNQALERRIIQNEEELDSLHSPTHGRGQDKHVERQFERLKRETARRDEIIKQKDIKLEEQEQLVAVFKTNLDTSNQKYYQQKETNKLICEKLTNLREFEKQYQKTLEDTEMYEEEKRNMVMQNKYLKNELDDLKEELKETKTRLSKLMSAQVTYNNPDIADLSDANRPTKLAERFAELYDNQWSDAFEALEDSSLYASCNEKEKVKLLLSILKMARHFCEEEADTLMKQLERVLLRARTDKPLPDAVTRQLKDIKKMMVPSNADNIYTRFIDSPGLSRIDIHGQQIQSYIHECIMICWIMVNNDPPIVFGPEIEHSAALDTSVYRHYTVKGDHVDYIVWPALFVTKGGALLCRGVAQGFEAIKTTHQTVRRPQTAPLNSMAYGNTQTNVLTMSQRPHTNKSYIQENVQSTGIGNVYDLDRSKMSKRFVASSGSNSQRHKPNPAYFKKYY